MQQKKAVVLHTNLADARSERERNCRKFFFQELNRYLRELVVLILCVRFLSVSHKT